MDLPPVLIALGAEIEAVGPAGRRRIPVERLSAGYFETVLAGNELIAAVVVPPQHGRRAVYVKVTTRAADDWPALGVAVSLQRDDGRIGEARIAVSAATERPMRLSGAEEMLAGGAPEAEVARAAAAEAPVVADDRGSEGYKRQLIAVHLRRALAEALV